MEQRYRLYIDESGDHVYREEDSLKKPQHRYLAVVGCLFEQPDYISFHDALEDLKQKYFPHNPDKAIILHRSEIINCKGPFWRLRNKETKVSFENDLLALLKQSNYIVIGIVIDKLAHKNNYPSTFHPYHLAMDFMLQRYCGLLNHWNRHGDVMVESRGRRENLILENAYHHIYTHGDMHNKAEFYKKALTTKNLKVGEKKDNVSGLQLADVLAYPVRQEILLEQGRILDPGPVFGKRISETIQDKYNRQLYTDQIEGYGKVLFPK